MATAAEDQVVLETVGAWRATPDNYASLRSMWLKADGSGELVYGYGQTIYASIQCHWEITTVGQLRLTYLDSPPYQRFRGYTPSKDRNVRELGYTLTTGRRIGVENVVANAYDFDHMLELSEPPWPTELTLPYEVPKVFFGRINEADQDGEPAATPDDKA